MGIFYKRPLCLFCFCFIGASLLACALGVLGKIVLLTLLSLLIALLLTLSFRIKSRKYGLIEAAICLIFTAAAILVSLLAIDLPISRLQKYTSESSPIEFIVCETKYSSKYNTEYEGILLATDKGKINKKAYLSLSHEVDFSAGDKLLLIGDVSLTEKETGFFSLPSDVNLKITSTIDKDLIISSKYESFNFLVLSAKLRNSIREIFIERLSPEAAALSLGVLTSNTSMLSGEVIRDFRRSGVSHLLAVSGLHLSLVIGACDLILIRLRVSKSLRCVLLTIASVILLTVSSFSLSACRAVTMLLITYLCYILSREPDTLTSLSIAATVILFVSPASVGSISFWLSFLATLGIILYSEALAAIRRKRLDTTKMGKVGKAFTALLKKTASALAVTLSANIFICIASWAFFGESSIISPLANLCITPLGEVYLVLTLIVLALGKIPFIGAVVCRVTTLLAAFLTSLASRLSSLDFSVISLKYAFAGIIIGAMTVALGVLFVVKLKRKRFLFITPILASALFCVGLFVYNATAPTTQLSCISYNGKDSVVIANDQKLTVIDISDGSYSPLKDASLWAKDNAFVEIESVVLTHYHERHISSLDKFFKSNMVRHLYLPPPKDSDELDILYDIVDLAKENGVFATLYQPEKETELCGDLSFFLLPESFCDSSSKKIITFAIQTADGLLCYLDSSWHLSDNADAIYSIAEHSSTIILGSHGPADNGESTAKLPPDANIIYPTKK